MDLLSGEVNMKTYLSRSEASVALGAGVGLATAPLVTHFLPGSIVGGQFPPWTNNDVLIPAGLGAVSLAAGILTDKTYSPFLVGFGVTSLISGILRGIYTPAAARVSPAAQQRQRMAAAVRARAQQQRAPGVSVQESKVGNASGQQLTPTGVPLTQILY